MTNKTGNQVSLFKTSWVVLKSWLWFFLVVGIFSVVWIGFGVAMFSSSQEHLALFVLATLIAFVLGFLSFVFNELIVILALKPKRIKTRQEAEDLDLQAYWDVVHELCEEMNFLVIPRIYYFPGSEREYNACAFGTGLPFMSAIGITLGLPKVMERDELRSIMAHELSHIRNKDMLIASVLIAMTTFFVIVGEILPRIFVSSDDDDRDAKGALALLVLAIVAILVGKVIGPLLQLLVSRKRELAADAAAARAVGNADFLIRAFEKLAASSSHVRRVGVATNTLFFVNALKGGKEESDFASTHPSMSKRIASLQKIDPIRD